MKPSHMWEPAFPVPESYSPNGNISCHGYYGLTQYAEVARGFQQAILVATASNDTRVVKDAFDQADAFFAELAKRTQS